VTNRYMSTYKKRKKKKKKEMTESEKMPHGMLSKKYISGIKKVKIKKRKKTKRAVYIKLKKKK